MTRNIVVAIATTIVVGLGILFQVTTAASHEEKSPDTGTHAIQSPAAATPEPIQENPGQAGKPGEVK